MGKFSKFSGDNHRQWGIEEIWPNIKYKAQATHPEDNSKRVENGEQWDKEREW